MTVKLRLRWFLEYNSKQFLLLHQSILAPCFSLYLDIEKDLYQVETYENSNSLSGL